MTRKDYEPIAAILRQAASKPEYRQRTYIASALADLFEKDNPRFNRMEFILACASE
jgi:hypothetical protein